MDEQNSENRVYFVGPLRQTMLGRIRQDIAKVDEQMRETQRELDDVNAAQAALGEIQLVLEQMRALAIRAASDPKADRSALQAEFERHKQKIDGIAARLECGGAGYPRTNLQNVRKAVAAVEAVVRP